MTYCHATGKTRHATRDKAHRHRVDLNAQRRANEPELTVYRCEECGDFHVGHVRNRVRRSA